ncbi:MAG: transcriptional regulator [Nitrospirae bacterium RIFOXYB2_FULL_43_5]|nr:MAG: transcriptional regulator [Nitrospirae bacterium GWF2_44_13]OGW35841.1 MAG: transcriptional regulator [Nitrospirae bacterium GWD2_44_7]OGW65144.1 MAG: transcriptional regulator [Nitrospirae bacterium RIFOXYA2_FULL_44_9]OGW72976.1 MAG: transcriptional regulator [Nitrospirae bacterium RIFOXYB2_FULL_43_5]OGW73641.1 MAG: transcriptional regulator [Nitrospirae bacterium RIFOXYC2_FULL_44_7]HBG93127.1 ArsR family transcriptional regulator [Nitrospiraceae bacterium]
METILTIFKALSDETRLRILKLLEHGELCVCDIVAALDMVQPKVSFHLGVLKEAGFIKDCKHGRWIHYKLDDADMFKRSLILSVLERTSNAAAAEDKKRLERFLKSKKTKTDCINLKNTARGNHA